ncbi:helix-turn-helix transcriptional regulator, partial [Streptomyces sp. NPDC056975]|uniref:helix-turn-helix transcriptional regulator n=1 Tax=Streptomyces sp. NPDC056975 TaxID=3345985 RepID=UPI00363CFCAE
APEAPGLADASLLTLLGLGPEEDAVYRLLVDRPDSDQAALADSGAGPDEIDRVLGLLVERGLAGAEHRDGTVRYRAAPPVLALGPLLESRRAALHRVESLVGDLAERHRSAQSYVPVEVLSGTVAIRRRLLAMQRQARHEVCSFVPAMPVPQVLTFQDNLEEAERDAMDRGVTLRAVVERGCLEQPDTARTLADVVAHGQQISVVEDLPIKMILVDGRAALLPLDPERDEVEPVALVVHRSGLLTGLQSLFEQHFAKGRRLGAHGAEGPGDGGGRELDSTDRQIVGLLHTGLTDAAIARQLGMGHRTVQRRLHALMDEVGAVTRFQLGWHAARAGWLDGETPNSGSPQGS